ncbi:MAG: hypothetical protein KBC38_03845 [Candidatus Pacebacteria bacterium]|nr:hypothetical protein [Candidatus Paceibacterota bacterium]MBP9840701.1 hypothetical protein [Candidatus Paceibacterota bacterium]
MANAEFESLMEALGRPLSMEKEALRDMSNALKNFEDAQVLDPHVIRVLGNLEQRIATIRMTHGPMKRLTELTDAVLEGPYTPSVGLGPNFTKPGGHADG